MIEGVLLVLTLVLSVIYHVYKKKMYYWETRRVPYEKPTPLLGNYGEFLLMKRSLPEVAQSICLKFPNAPYFGAFYGTEPTLIVQDPEIVKLIMTKDFYYFSSREISSYTHKEVLTQNLFFTYGDRWKVLRQNLTPLFSSTKMKNMFHLIEKCSHSLENMLNYEFNKNNVVEIRALIARFTMDGIGSCAFGINTKTMENDSKDNSFTTIGNSLFLETYYRGFKLIARAIWPAIFYGLGMKSFPTEVDRFFYNLIMEVIKGRNYKPSGRNDFVDLILKFKENKFITGDRMANMKGDDKKVFLDVDDEFLVGQCILFFAAGYETSSTTLQYLFYELAKHPEEQNRLIEEVDEYLKRHDNKLVYECVTEMPYAEACINEAMRLYPVLGVITREVIERYTLPCGAVLDKGVRVHIPVHHLHHHPDHFPEPEQFRPERFYGDEKQYVKPYTYLPFGEGPRICIGMRFAKMQMLAGIITFYKKYRVELAEGTPRKLQFGVTTIVTQPVKQIKLKLIKRITKINVPLIILQVLRVLRQVMFEAILIVLFVLLSIIYYIGRKKYNYWKIRKIPYAKPTLFLGNYGEYVLMHKYYGQVTQSICQKFPNELAFFGTEPTLIIQDPDILKRIMTKDFYYCNGREISKYTHKEIFTQNLFFTYGDQWKVLRQNLTPLFSSTKMKNMFHLIEKCCHRFENMLDYESSKNNVIKVRALIARFTMDSITTCAFGINSKTMDTDSNDNPFTYMGTSLFLETYYRGFKLIARSIWPSIFYGLGMKSFPTEVDRFFYNLITGVLKEREYKPSARNDFVDLVLSLKEKKGITGDSIANMRSEDKKITLEIDDAFLVAQCVLFFAGGFETSSTTLQYLLYELAKNPEEQNKVHEEVDEYLKRHNNKLGYDCATEMPFLEACISESLRLYPVFGVLTREVAEPYTLPCGAVLDKGVRIHIPVYHIHHNPLNYPEPEEFRPERFYGDEKQSIKPFTNLAFGEGPRVCIGMRFAKMQMIASVITLLKKYRVELAEGTSCKIEFGVTTIVTQPAKEIKLKLVERDGWEHRTLA
ncbi:LOW QUALITY PROTEIN: uncharacterized protein ACR2FA_006459 [Aphomia sociella]